MQIELSEIVKGAFQSQDQFGMLRHQQMMQEMRDQNPGNFFIELGKGFSNKNLPSHLRVIMAQIIVNTFKENYQNSIYWNIMPNNMKNDFENIGLQNLVDEDHDIQRSACVIVAEIFILKLNGEKWTGLLKSLSDQASNPDHKIQKAAITTLGFICENLNRAGNKHNLDSDEIESILQTICTAIGENQHDFGLKSAGLQSFQYSTQYFIDTLREHRSIRMYVMNQLVKCTLSDDTNIKMLAWQSLSDLAEHLYDDIGEYLEVISNFSCQVFQNNTIPDQIRIPATEFWTLIAKEEAARKHDESIQNELHTNTSSSNKMLCAYPKPNRGYMAYYYDKILPKVMMNLQTITSDEILDGNSLSLFSTSSKCCQFIIEACQDKTKSIVVEYIQTFIEDKGNWQGTVSSLIVFKHFLNSASEQECREQINSTFGNIVKYLVNDVKLIRHAAAYLLNDVSKRHNSYLQNFYFIQSQYDNILEVIQNGDPELVAHLCQFIENIATIDPNDKQAKENCIITKYTMKTIQILMQAAHNTKLEEQDSNTIESAFQALLSIVPVYFEHNLKLNNINCFLDIIKNIPQDFNKANFQVIKRCCYINITFIVGTFLKDEFLLNRQYTLDEKKEYNTQYFRPLSMQVINDIKSDSTAYEDGVIMLGYQARLMKTDFQDLFDSIWPYIGSKLEKNDDSNMELTKVCFDTTCLFIKENFLCLEEIENFVRLILNSQSNPNINPELKPYLLNNQAEVVVCRVEVLNPFIDDIHKLYFFAYDAITSSICSDSSNNFEYISCFKESVIESLTSIVFMIAENTTKLFGKVVVSLIQQHFPKFREFVIKTCSKEAMPTVEYIRDCIYLITDFTRAWPIDDNSVWKVMNEMIKSIKIPVFDDILTTLETYQDKTTGVKDCLEYLNRENRRILESDWKKQQMPNN